MYVRARFLRGVSPNPRLGFSTKRPWTIQRRSSLVEISINLVPSGVGGKHRNATNRSIFAIWPCPGGALELTRTEPPTSIHPPSRYTNESMDFCRVYRVVWSFSILFIETRKIKPFDLWENKSIFRWNFPFSKNSHVPECKLCLTNHHW